MSTTQTTTAATRPDWEPQKVQTVLVFKYRQEGNQFLLKARHGYGIKGHYGLPVISRNGNLGNLREGARLVELTIGQDQTRFKLVRDRRQVEEIIDDLTHQGARVQASTVDSDWQENTVHAVLHFQLQQNGDKGPRLVARYGAGINGGQGLVVFANNKSAVPVKTGSCLARISLAPNRRYALATISEDLNTLNSLIQDLTEQLTSIS